RGLFTTLLLALCGAVIRGYTVNFTHQQESGPPKIADTLSGSVWNSQEPHQDYRINFLQGHKLSFKEPGKPAEDGDWELDGTNITLNVHSGTTQYSGTMVNNDMSGTVTNHNSRKSYPFHAHKTL